MTSQEIARQAASQASTQWRINQFQVGGGPSEQDFLVDAVAVAMLREAIGQLEARAAREPHAVALGMSVAIDIIEGAVAAFAPAPVAPPAQEPEMTIPVCQLCGQPMPPGEEMFNYHGYSGPCPTPQVGKSEQCRICKGKGWVTPSIKMYPGDRVQCSCQKPTAPSPSDVEQAASQREAFEAGFNMARDGSYHGGPDEDQWEPDYSTAPEAFAAWLTRQDRR